jgi:hypothetical protein
MVLFDARAVVVHFPPVDLGLQDGLPPRDSAGYPLRLEWGLSIGEGQLAKLLLDARVLALPASLEHVVELGSIVGCNTTSHMVECSQSLRGHARVVDGRVLLEIFDSAFVSRVSANAEAVATLWVQRYWGRQEVWRGEVPLVQRVR